MFDAIRRYVLHGCQKALLLCLGHTPDYDRPIIKEKYLSLGRGRVELAPPSLLCDRVLVIFILTQFGYPEQIPSRSVRFRLRGWRVLGIIYVRSIYHFVDQLRVCMICRSTSIKELHKIVHAIRTMGVLVVTLRNIDFVT